MSLNQKFKLEEIVEPLEIPKRVAFIKRDTSAQVKVETEETVMSCPDLLLRLVVGLEILLIILAVLSLVIDAPLEEMANPEHTPNPAKAPWYFLGLQELLHLFPPFVAGVLLPLLVVVALVVIPYFEINIKREGMWKSNQRQTFFRLTTFTAIIVITFSLLKAYSISIPTLLIYGYMILPYLSKKESGFIERLAGFSLAEWVMTWFVLVAGVLTLIGILFRGPGWEWTWPWQGIY